MAEYEVALLDQTIAVWQPYYEQPLTREDARVILENMVMYVRILMEWDGAVQETGKIPEGGHC